MYNKFKEKGERNTLSLGVALHALPSSYVVLEEFLNTHPLLIDHEGQAF